MSSECFTSTNREDFTGKRVITPPRWNTPTADDMLLISNHETDSRRTIRKKQTHRKKSYQKERSTDSEMFGVDHKTENEMTCNKTDIGDSKLRDEKRNEDLSLDFSWLTKDFHLENANDLLTCDVTVESCHNEGEQCLSQRTASLTPALEAMHNDSDLQYERSCIEEEIRQKYAELNVILKQLHTRRHNQKRRRKTQAKKSEVNKEIENEQWTPSHVNICPIRRRKRSAQPIRNALLVRTSMRKAWKGMLGSCCGKGCWATWKWVNLKGVMSDYE